MLPAMVVCALLASPAHAALLGVTPDLSWGIDAQQQAQQARVLQAVGVRFVRLNIEWAKVEPRPGYYDQRQLQHVDEAIDAARAHGMGVLMLLSTSPRWASGSADKQAPPRNPATFARFARYVTKRWATRVYFYEIWNEENIRRFWPSGPSARSYVRLLRAGYRAIKAANPRSYVLFGGTSGNDYRFLEHAYHAGAKGFFDLMAVHPYTCTGPDRVVRVNGRIARGSYLGYREVRRTMVRHHDPHPIWFTEFGWSTNTRNCGVSAERQAVYLARAIELADQNPYVQVALWYGWRNLYWRHDANSLESQFGLVTAANAPKLSMWVFYALAAKGMKPSIVARTLTSQR